ncbi:hypothetical protein ABBQ38_005898 [Trebouxia sp. C0009 RCD-2024]
MSSLDSCDRPAACLALQLLGYHCHVAAHAPPRRSSAAVQTHRLLWHVSRQGASQDLIVLGRSLPDVGSMPEQQLPLTPHASEWLPGTTSTQWLMNQQQPPHQQQQRTCLWGRGPYPHMTLPKKLQSRDDDGRPEPSQECYLHKWRSGPTSKTVTGPPARDKGANAGDVPMHVDSFLEGITWAVTIWSLGRVSETVAVNDFVKAASGESATDHATAWKASLMKSEPEILSSPDTLGPRMTTLEQADSSSALPSESGNWLGLLAVREHRKQMVEWADAAHDPKVRECQRLSLILGPSAAAAAAWACCHHQRHRGLAMVGLDAYAATPQSGAGGALASWLVMTMVMTSQQRWKGVQQPPPPMSPKGHSAKRQSAKQQEACLQMENAPASGNIQNSPNA